MQRAIFGGFAADSGALRIRYDVAGCPGGSSSRGLQTQVRFDDSLKTVLSAETASGHGAAASWRQLVDLVGRGRVPAGDAPIERLRMLRDMVPAAVRAASARALAFASPPAALVALFGEDSLDIAAPVLRTATLGGDDWAAILPRLSPAGRSVLRHRRDLPADAVRALEAFGATDFVLDYAAPPAHAAPRADPEPLPSAPLGPTPFVPLGEVARGLPVVAEALRRVEIPAEEAPRFEIADLVARIDAFNRGRERTVREPETTPPEPQGFRFEADAAGAICWVEGVTRTPLVGLSLAHAARQGEAQVDGAVAGAYRRRSPFQDARLVVGGTSDAAGGWRLSGIPAFDPASGRFLGYRGTARRPRADESATPRRNRETSDSLRQLVHELRTPTNAIAGFAELIETELLGPVAGSYRRHAAEIRGQASALIQAIDDLDTAARMEGDALDLRPVTIALRPLIAAALDDLQPLADLRGATVTLVPGDDDGAVIADDRALERLVNRLLAATMSAAAPGEPVSIAIAPAGDAVTMVIDRPVALGEDGDAAEDEGAPLLGAAFALRLASNLAVELGGALVIDAERLTLRLRAASEQAMGQASTN